MDIIDKIKQDIKTNIQAIYQQTIEDFDLDCPPQDELGDYAFSCFNLAKKLSKNPIELAKELATAYQAGPLIKSVKNIGPYLNLFISDDFIRESIIQIGKNKNIGHSNYGQNKKILIEFSGPNTNKPQHVGHVRNNCIGQALVNIYKAAGYKTTAVNIINDRGIHIVKSMLAWQEFGNGETPKSSGVKGDHLVGKYYVKFGQLLKEEEQKYLAEKKISLDKLDNLSRKKVAEEFLANSKWMKKAHTMLQDWENDDPEVCHIWKTMNDWVYAGYDETYKALGIEFDHLDFESDTYLLGKNLVDQGLKKKVFFKKADGSVWIDLTADGLDQKIILRSDGTSVYITQDLGTAEKRYKKFKFDQAIYVVANEQEYHFKVLFLTLAKLGFKWAKNLHHLSYGMVSLPGGKIKSREGKTADADELIATMIRQAQAVMNKAEKKIDSSDEQKANIATIVGLGALKFFMLSTNPQKNIIFKPEESISFDGYTGTFIQYTHARIFNMLKKNTKLNNLSELKEVSFNDEEKKLIRSILSFTETVQKAAITYNPSLITQYLFELAKIYNNFYQKHKVLNAPDEKTKQSRLQISQITKKTLKEGLKLLGIEAPEIM
ncbi:MAG: arginine--tRNA ligase [Candidatus Komeilibacteria bacterium RIFOXYC1_FULL_37_11]|uniref:Arginine--tRNA ligase n=1 Tax=Candidatus Komeilibacteria bacterium RIFOXYC1_FULL_37_11 TaxID=1798555 RepID=A0A1G2BWY9_9BACT|nr:MAG: arginine--tRNA ligase [Candidatus Komeilibacteria bacterium RIFOXYC1_FULL_37_11]OGY95863.1 MAG: arginine--tRNA ligase [Candidatus Komeilibacteria bacterium RIFOXYD1_FULL_37_29]